MIYTLHRADRWGMEGDMVASFNLADPNLHRTPGPRAVRGLTRLAPSWPSHITHTHTQSQREDKKAVESSQKGRVFDLLDEPLLVSRARHTQTHT